MRILGLRIGAATVFAVLAGTADGQRSEQTASQTRAGYEQVRLGSEDVAITIRGEKKTLRVAFSKLRMAQAGAMAPIKLTGDGLALIQHSAGQAKLIVGNERFEPFEGEWLRLPLPAEFSLGTENDSIVLDMILIEELKQ
jgi:hypothetical protein